MLHCIKMSAKRKRNDHDESLWSPPPHTDTICHIKASLSKSKSVPSFKGFPLNADEIKTCLSMKYGHGVVSQVIAVLEKVPTTIPDKMREEIFVDEVPGDQVIALEIYNQLKNCVNFSCQPTDAIVIAPPVGFCTQCTMLDNTQQRLLKHNDPITIKHIKLTGVNSKKKVTLKCPKCETNYNVTQWGNIECMKFYKEQSPYIEVSSWCVADRDVLEQYCSLHLHSWVTFEGYAEQYNTLFQRDESTGLSRKLVRKLYYRGEVEGELRRLNLLETAVSLANLKPVLELINQHRMETLYAHECTEHCLSKGCKELHVADGLWKLVFNVCSMRTKNVVQGFSLVSYPDQCTEQPAIGQCFCEEHVEVMQREGIPTRPKEFVEYCKNRRGDASSSSCSANEEVPDEEVQELIADLTHKKHPILRTVGSPAISSHGANKMVNEQGGALPCLLASCVDEGSSQSSDPCHKETGRKEGLHMKSRGYMFIVTAGGFIETFSPLYRSESPSQAFLIMLTFLYTLLKDQPISEWSKIWIAYDNMCNITRMKAAREPTLPLPGEFAFMWSRVNKMIDAFHIVNHKKTSKCQQDLHPDRFKQANPHLKSMNSSAAEQCFNWLGRYKRQICSMPKTEQLFMLHRLALRRNLYVSRCHAKKQDPAIPHVKV